MFFSLIFFLSTVSSRRELREGRAQVDGCRVARNLTVVHVKLTNYLVLSSKANLAACKLKDTKGQIVFI